MSDMKNGDVELGKETPVKSKKNIAIFGGIAAAVLVVLILIVSLVSGGYKAPIKNYFNGMQKASSKTYLKAYPSFMREKMEDSYDDDAMEKMKSYLEKQYGDKIKITYKVLDKTKIEKEDLEKVRDNLKEKYDEKIKVSAGYKVCVKATIKGSDEKDTDYSTMNVYKINGKWCIID